MEKLKNVDSLCGQSIFNVIERPSQKVFIEEMLKELSINEELVRMPTKERNVMVLTMEKKKLRSK